MDIRFTDLQRLPDRDLLHRVLGEGALGITSLARAFGLQLGDETVHRNGGGHHLLLCARELLTRALAETIQDKPIFGQPMAVQAFLRLKLDGLSYESFWVLYLDARHGLISAEEMFRGTLTQTSVSPARNRQTRPAAQRCCGRAGPQPSIRMQPTVTRRRGADADAQVQPGIGGRARAGSLHCGQHQRQFHGRHGPDLAIVPGAVHGAGLFYPARRAIPLGMVRLLFSSKEFHHANRSNPHLP